MDYILVYISPADLEVACLLGLLYIVSAVVVSLLSPYYKEVGKVVSDFISGTPCTDYCDKYFLFMFSIKAIEYYIQIVNLKSLVNNTEDSEAVSRCVDRGLLATFTKSDA